MQGGDMEPKSSRKYSGNAFSLSLFSSLLSSFSLYLPSPLALSCSLFSRSRSLARSLLRAQASIACVRPENTQQRRSSRLEGKDTQRCLWGSYRMPVPHHPVSPSS
jgi:hypothetical protein